MKIFFILGILIFTSTVGWTMENSSEKLKTYRWESLEDQKKYEGASWNSIEISLIEGFSPKAVVELKDECAYGDKTKGPYLIQFGGKCNAGYWLEIKRGGKMKKINTLEKLKKEFSPVESEAEAASFVAITQRIQGVLKEKNKFETIKIPEGYLVKTKLAAPFGCNDIASYDAIFKVSPSGNIKLLAKKENKLPSGKTICRD